MRNTRSKRLIRALTAFSFAAAASAASAQEALRPPRAAGDLSSSKYVMMALAVLLVGAVVFVVTLKSKRGHQD
jgi:hypothetical protein